ncbi:N-formylglutamate deformylase [Bremerella sp. JC770]|uniref:N-formylglutamate deformylase n=1 Tax=Bremerella sp. JC770 TaxID=3232137 RepID=UPI00345AC344
MIMLPVSVIEGDSPIVLANPHSGTYVPEPVSARFTSAGKRLADTDWHIDRLYDGLLPGATVVRANFHRYVVDANRSPCNESLYPGQNTTGLIPQTTFEGEPIWKTPATPEESQSLVEAYHAPYHLALLNQLTRIRAQHGIALLYDCHSIRNQLPFLFEGLLPDFNIGTNDSAACDLQIEEATFELCRKFTDRSVVVNGRFKGGWTTRHYGKPGERIHAIQMEISQSMYLRNSLESFEYDEHSAVSLRQQLAEVLHRLESLVLSLR